MIDQPNDLTVERISKPALYMMGMNRLVQIATGLEIQTESMTDKKGLINAIIEAQNERAIGTDTEEDARKDAGVDLLGDSVQGQDTDEDVVASHPLVKQLQSIVQVLHSRIQKVEADRDGRLKQLEGVVAGLAAAAKHGKSLHGSVDNLGKVEDLKHG